MAEKKTTTTKKTSKPKDKLLTLAEAAEHLGITERDLMLSRGRGLPPGKLGFKDAGVLVWRASDLAPAEAPTEEPTEE